MSVKYEIAAGDLEGAASRLRSNSKAARWLRDHGGAWEGLAEISTDRIAINCDGHSDAVAVIERAIVELRNEIFARACQITEERHAEARNTVRIVADLLEGKL